MRLLSFLLLLCCASIAFAQSQILSGSVTDSRHAPVAATITLLKATDSSWVQTVLTDDEGRFQFLNVDAQKYLLDVQALGYASKKVAIAQVTVEPVNVILENQANTLQQVTVTAVKPFIENSAGMLTINVSSSTASVGSNVFDILKKSPGVTIDEEGNISLQGKQGITVLINERPTYLSGRQLADYLRALPSDDITKLELITQPSARYDAEGTGGIINIVQKKNKKEGLNGSASVTPGMGIYPNIGSNASVTWKRGRWNTYTNASYRKATGFLRGRYKRNLLNEEGNVATHIDGEVFMKEIFSDDMLRAGTDYDINEKATAGLMVTGNYHPNSQLDQTVDKISSANTNSFYSKAQHEQGLLRKRLLANVYLNKKLSDKHKIVTNADYTRNYTKKRQYLHNTIEDESGNDLGNGLLVRSWQPVDINAYSLKSDYSGVLSGSANIEAGIKCSYTNIDNNADYDINTNGNWTDDAARTNHFIYRENINAAYVSMNGNLNEKCKVQAGLRMENAVINGEEVVTNQKFTRHTTSLFPTAYFSYHANEKNEWQINYGRRIQRPRYNILNPFPEYTSQYHYSIGNPALKPEMIQQVELTHVYAGMVTTSVGCSRSKHVINEIVYQDAKEPNATFNKNENIANESRAFMSATVYEKLKTWWEISVMGYGYYSDYHNEYTGGHRYGKGWGVNIDSQFVFHNGWRAEGHVAFSGRSQDGIYGRREPAVYSSCGVSKRVLKDSGSLRLHIEDPFFANSYSWSANTGDIIASGKVKQQTIYYGLSFVYNFGTNSETRQREAANDEVRRM